MSKDITERFINDFVKEFGTEKAMKLSDERAMANVQNWIPVLKSMKKALHTEGLPEGRMVLVHGKECLSAETFIQYHVRTKDGKHQNAKGGTIERLYQRFHKIQPSGRGYNVRKQTIDSEFWVPSLNSCGRIEVCKIKDVVDAGEKECFTLTTKSGLLS